MPWRHIHSAKAKNTERWAHEKVPLDEGQPVKSLWWLSKHKCSAKESTGATRLWQEKTGNIYDLSSHELIEPWRGDAGQGLHAWKNCGRILLGRTHEASDDIWRLTCWRWDSWSKARAMEKKWNSRAKCIQNSKKRSKRSPSSWTKPLAVNSFQSGKCYRPAHS